MQREMFHSFKYTIFGQAVALENVRWEQPLSLKYAHWDDPYFTFHIIEGYFRGYFGFL